MKGLVIPEVNNEAMASPPPPTSNTSSSASSTGTGNTNKLSPPPWKSTAEVPSKYSPAYKRKPFTVYGTSSSSNSTVVTTEKSRLVPASTGTGNKNNNNNTHSTVSQILLKKHSRP